VDKRPANRTHYTVSMTNEAAWIEQLRQGNEDSFADIFAAYRKTVFRTAYLIVGNTVEAEDILQQTFFQLWRWRTRVTRPILPWLLKVTTNAALSFWRSKKETTVPEDSLLLELPVNHYGAVEEKIFYRQVIDALYQLPRRQRAVCVLRLLHEFSEAETATILGCRPGTVRATLFQAKERIRSTLGTE